MTTNVLPTTNPLPGTPGETRPSSPKPGIETSRDQTHGNKPSLITRVKAVLDQEVDNKRVDWVSIYACLLTGFTASISFSACFIWCGFQTGNLAQLGLAIARTFAPDTLRTYGFQLPDIQALVSLLSFLVGASLGRFENLFGGGRRKSWLVTATFVQCLLAAAAAIAHHYSGEYGIALSREFPAWDSALGLVTLGFLSATMGLQGIMGKRVGSPMNTTVVLTTTWVELFNDPLLGSVRHVHSRDVRIAGILAVFFGAFFSRAIHQSPAGPVGAMGVLCALRFGQIWWWVFTPAVPVKTEGKV